VADRPIIALAGAGGDLGGRIARALAACGADVRALVRPGLKDEERARIEALGVTPVSADPADVNDMARAVTGAACVVSALNGLRDVMIGRQGVLLDAAVKADVPRFIPSDYAADFTRTPRGRNRNFDLRREFMARVDAAPIRATSILNGAFLDMLGAEMPIIQPRIHRVLYWHDADQILDFTSKDDVAAYAAAATLDDTAPRILRIAGDSVSARDIATTMSSVTGERYRPLWAGTLGSLGMVIRLAKLVGPQPDAAFPPWQGMQYMRDQFSGRVRLVDLDSGRYELERLSHETAHSPEFLAPNPKGAVPTMTTKTSGDRPFVLTESLAVLLYIAAQNPAARLGATEGDALEQARMNEVMAELVSEVHKAFVPAFVPDRFVIEESAQDGARARPPLSWSRRRSGASTAIWRAATGSCSIGVRSPMPISMSCRGGWRTPRRRCPPIPMSRGISRSSRLMRGCSVRFRKST